MDKHFTKVNVFTALLSLVTLWTCILKHAFVYKTLSKGRRAVTDNLFICVVRKRYLTCDVIYCWWL